MLSGLNILIVGCDPVGGGGEIELQENAAALVASINNGCYFRNRIAGSEFMPQWVDAREVTV